MTVNNTESYRDFIRDIINDDLRANKYDGRVHTRFPPEPNGYLHIGHAKSICLNFGIANDYNGLCNLRFDDTNPIKEEQEYIDSIIENVHWLGFDWEDRLYYASDYFEQMYQYAVQLIEAGKAYVDELSAGEIRDYRGTLIDPGKQSPYRDRPVEVNLECVTQTQLNLDAGLSYERCLRFLLRQDPEVILIGEIRDTETAKLCVQAALTGHLVLSTMHTNDAAGAVTRMMDMGIESYKVAASLVGVVAQRLVRKICPKCRAVYYPSAEVLDGLKYRGDRRRTFVRGEGCSECFDTGFQGRYAALDAFNKLRACHRLGLTELFRQTHRVLPDDSAEAC